MRKRINITMMTLLAVVSCQKQQGIELDPVPVAPPDATDIIDEVSANVPPISFEDNGKSTLVLSGSTLAFKWNKDDKLGFFPLPSNVTYGPVQQAVFHINADQTDGQPSKFVSNGWGLLRNEKYFSYFPYAENATSTAVGVNFEVQTQSANESTAHLSKKDYMHAAKEITSANAVLDYKHLCCVARFALTIPEAQKSRQFNKFTVTAPSNVLILWANYVPTLDVPTFKDQNYVNSLSMNLSNITCNSSNQLVLYMMMLPVALSGKTLTLKLTDTEGYTYEGKVSATANQQAGMGYGYSANMTYCPHDLSINGTANSYIVSAKGDYKFKATVKGNSTTSVGTVNSADIVWETQNTTTAPAKGGIVKDITYKDGYIYFSTPSTFKKGNALIAAKNSSGIILWSWHIWCTDAPADQVYKNSAGTLMDRNLGALATTGDASMGLLYQWGRKDPFLGSAKLSSASQMKSVGKQQSIVKKTSSNGTIAYTLENPTVFIYHGTATGSDALNWLSSTNVNANLWKNTSGSVKTMYDPCPPGYRVADGSTTANTEAGRGFYGKALGFNFQVVGTTNINNKGVTWDKTNHMMSITLASGKAYYPGTGCMQDSDGSFLYVGEDVVVWTNVGAGAGSTSAWNTQFSGTLDGNFTNSDNYQLTVNWNSGRAAGKSVRCQKESTTKMSSTKANESFSNLTDPGW